MDSELNVKAYQQHAMFYQLSPGNLLGLRKITFTAAILTSFVVHVANVLRLSRQMGRYLP